MSGKGSTNEKDAKLPGSLISLLVFGVIVGVSWFSVWALFLSRG